MAERPVVIVTGADSPTGLTAARSLRDYPVRCWGLVEQPGTPAGLSRHWERIVHSTGNDEARVSQLVELGRRGMQESGDRPLLLLSQDEWVMRASRNRDRLGETLQLVLPEHDILMRLMDKTLFQEWAAAQGLPVPGAVIVHDRESLAGALEQIGLPCIFKPLVRNALWDSRYPQQKFLACEDEAGVQALLDASGELFAMSGRCVLQQWIPGDDGDVVFCLMAYGPDGGLLGSFTGRKIWQWPPLGGSTAICIDHECSEVETISRQLMQACGYRGLGSVEFKRHRDSGRYLITEPTVGRNDYQSLVAACAGSNLTGELVESVFGVQAAKRRRRRRVIWMDELASLRRARTERSGFIRLFWLLARHIARRRCFLLLSAGDTRPFREQVGRLLRGTRRASP